MRVLLVEDDRFVADGLCRRLELAGHTVTPVRTGGAALIRLGTTNFDIMIVDIGLTDMDGFELIAKTRESANRLPIIVASAYDQVVHRVRGLDSGADDYLVKPFQYQELEARMRAVMRNRAIRAPKRLTFGGVTIDEDRHQASIRGENIDLTGREWQLLQLFLSQPGVALAKKRIAQKLETWRDNVTFNAVETHVSRLRTKIAAGDVRIRNIRGFGYMLELAAPKKSAV